eukprot:1869979-Amphidinium_carterae.1
MYFVAVVVLRQIRTAIHTLKVRVHSWLWEEQVAGIDGMNGVWKSLWALFSDLEDGWLKSLFLFKKPPILISAHQTTFSLSRCCCRCWILGSQEYVPYHVQMF